MEAKIMPLSNGKLIYGNLEWWMVNDHVLGHEPTYSMVKPYNAGSNQTLI